VDGKVCQGKRELDLDADYCLAIKANYRG